MAFLAERPPGRYSSASEICDHENIPPAFLGKVFLPLCRCRLVRSLRGIGGGYELAIPPEQIRLMAIVRAIDGTQLENCLLEDHPCGDPHNCLLHPAWCAVREQFANFLERTTLADLARAKKAPQVPIADADQVPEVTSSKG
jgi:Rrf2 family iron-sulfur cluster assembly transcriptional regulator